LVPREEEEPPTGFKLSAGRIFWGRKKRHIKGAAKQRKLPHGVKTHRGKAVVEEERENPIYGTERVERGK